MTGFEILEHLAKEGLCRNTLKVILTIEFMTDDTNSDFMAEREKELGVSCWCVKPFDNDSKRSHFVAVLETILEKNRYVYSCSHKCSPRDGFSKLFAAS